MLNRENKKLIDKYIASREKNKRKFDHKTIRLDRTISIHVLTWCGENHFKNAPALEPDFVDYIMQQGYSQNYCRKVINWTGNFFKWLARNKNEFRILKSDWLDTFKYSTYPEEFNENKTISEAEMVMIAKLPTNSLVEKRVRAGACFLYLSGMRISAFTSMPIKAVSLEELEVRQSPSLGMLTKNKKSATTYILNIKGIIEVVREWDLFVRSALPSDAYWFAPISPITCTVDLKPQKANENRSAIFRKNLKAWLSKHQMPNYSPHAFRRGHANYLFNHARDWSDLDAAKEQLMHSSLLTTELYARKRSSQVKSHIQNMSKPLEETDLYYQFHNVVSQLTSLSELLRNNNEI